MIKAINKLTWHDKPLHHPPSPLTSGSLILASILFLLAMILRQGQYHRQYQAIQSWYLLQYQWHERFAYWHEQCLNYTQSDQYPSTI